MVAPFVRALAVLDLANASEPGPATTVASPMISYPRMECVAPVRDTAAKDQDEDCKNSASRSAFGSPGSSFVQSLVQENEPG